MALTHEIHRMTVEEYLRVVDDLGWERTELIEGVVYDVPAEYNRHADTVMFLLDAVRSAFPDDIVRNVGSVLVSPRSIFDPDVYVIARSAVLDPDGAVPVDGILLAVEVSVGTQAHDRGPKLRAYADAGVGEVWLIDPRPGVEELVRYRDPEGASYLSIDRFPVGENAADLDVVAILAR
jgi:Uma2 family endonuclease